MPRALPTKARKEQRPQYAPLQLAVVLDALGDDVRLSIVRQLDQIGEKACGTFGIEIPKSTLSHHFRVLRKAGVLSVRRDGKELMNAIRREELEARFPGLLAAVVNGM